MPSPPLRATWRRVDARVHLALSPAQLEDPVASATEAAFHNLLMRYNHSLKGVVVAHIGPLKLKGPPTFIDASPFAHVAGSLQLLLFNPPAGSVMVGVINYVGPDHLALRVFRTFHAVLPLHAVANKYKYDTGNPHRWCRTDHLSESDRDLTIGRQVRFVVSRTKATREGLFQILATLDHTVSYEPIPPTSLGLLTPSEEIPGQAVSTQPSDEHEDSDAPSVDVLHVTKRSSIQRARRDSRHDPEQLLLAGDSAFGDMFAPVNPDQLGIKQTPPNGSAPQVGRMGQASRTAHEQTRHYGSTVALHKTFSDDDDDDDESNVNQTNVGIQKEVQRTKQEDENAHPQLTTAFAKQGRQNADNSREEESARIRTPVRTEVKQKEEIKPVTKAPTATGPSQESRQSEEKSSDKRRKSKHEKKKKRIKEEKEKHSTPKSKRKKKRRHSASLLEENDSAAKVEADGAHFSLTELKKRKKGKDKEKRKEKDKEKRIEKDKTKRTDKEKKKEKHRYKERRKHHEHELGGDHTDSQLSTINKTQSSLKSAASSLGENKREKHSKIANSKERTEGDNGESSPSQNHVISTKYESALEAVNLALLASQDTAETKSEPVRDGRVQYHTQRQGKVTDTGKLSVDVPVKARRENAKKDCETKESKLHGREPIEGTTGKGKSKTKKDEQEKGSFKRKSQEKSEKKKKRKRERSEGDGSERKKKKSRHKHEAMEQKQAADQKEASGPSRETEAPRRTPQSKVSALASAISRSLSRQRMPWRTR